MDAIEYVLCCCLLYKVVLDTFVWVRCGHLMKATEQRTRVVSTVDLIL